MIRASETLRMHLGWFWNSGLEMMKFNKEVIMMRKLLLGFLMVAIVPGVMALDNTWLGPTGGFGVYSARSLPAKDYAVSFYFANIDREWELFGYEDNVSLDYSYFLLPVAFGVTDRLELSVSPNYLNIRRNMGFEDSDGMGDLFVNMKVNFYDADSFAVGALFQAKIATADEDEGLGTGEHDYGLSLLMTKDWETSRINMNAGYRIVGEPEGADFDNQMLYGLGFESDLATDWQFIAEFTGETSYNEYEPNDPMDVTAGFRYHNPNGFVFGGGVRYAFGMDDYNCPVGGFVQIGFASPRESRPTPAPTPAPIPDLTCTVEDLTVGLGESTRVRVEVKDTLGGELTYEWTTSGCRLEADGNEAVFYADDCGPGSYAVNVKVTNAGGYSNQCGVMIKVGDVAPDMQLMKLDLPLVPFQSGTRVDNVAKAILDDIAVKIKEYPGVTVELVGHSDSDGSESENMKIGMTRAENVKAYLVERHQIEPARLNVTSMGETQPVADNATAAGRITNRRVEVIMMVETPVR